MESETQTPGSSSEPPRKIEAAHGGELLCVAS